MILIEPSTADILTAYRNTGWLPRRRTLRRELSTGEIAGCAVGVILGALELRGGDAKPTAIRADYRSGLEYGFDGTAPEILEDRIFSDDDEAATFRAGFWTGWEVAAAVGLVDDDPDAPRCHCSVCVEERAALAALEA